MLIELYCMLRAKRDYLKMNIDYSEGRQVENYIIFLWFRIVMS